MTKINIIIKLLLKLFIIFNIIFLPCKAKISDKRKCYNKDCSEIISLGRTLIHYRSNDPGVLSFQQNVPVNIYSKDAGDRTDLWGVEINSVRGYAPKNLIRETKVLKKNLDFIVSTAESSNEESNKEDVINNVENSEKNIADENQNASINKEIIADEYLIKSDQIAEDLVSPDVVTPSYESIYDGTVLPENNEDLENSHNTSTLTTNNADNQENPSIYPNIIASTISLVSGMLSSSNEESIENSVEITSSETNILDSDSLKTPEIVKTDTDLPDVQEINNDYSGETVHEKAFYVNVTQKVSELNETNNNKSLENISQDDLPVDDINLSVNIVNNEENLISVTEKTNSDAKVNIENDVPILVLNDNNENLSKVDTNKNLEDNQGHFENLANPVNSLTSLEENVKESVMPLEENVKESVTSLEENVKEPLLSSVNNIKEEYVTNNSNINENLEVNEIADNLSNDKDPTLSIQNTEEILSSVNINDHNINNDKKDLYDSENIVNNESITVDSVNNLSDENNNLPNESEKNLVKDAIVDKIDMISTEVNDTISENLEPNFRTLDSPSQDILLDNSQNIIRNNRNLLNTDDDLDKSKINSNIEEGSSIVFPTTEEENVQKDEKIEVSKVSEALPDVSSANVAVDTTASTCQAEECPQDITADVIDENAVSNSVEFGNSYNSTTIIITGAIIFCSFLYFYFSNRKRDLYLLVRINELEKELMVARKECVILDESFKTTKAQLDSSQNESSGSNEMVTMLKNELSASEKMKSELEEQVIALEKELETAADSGLELQHMLHELLSKKEEDDTLTQLQDLQEHLNTQRVVNENLTKTLVTKEEENESLKENLQEISLKNKKLNEDYEKLNNDLKVLHQKTKEKEESLNEEMQRLQFQVQTIFEENELLEKQLNIKESEYKQILSVIKQFDSNEVDFEKLYDTVHAKAEVSQLHVEKEKLKEQLIEVTEKCKSLEACVENLKEELNNLSQVCKTAEKEKKDSETRLQVLTKFFEEKEAQRQKEEALWLEKQGEVTSTVEKLQSMQNEILNYKKQIEILKSEIVNQELEYKNQISVLETKAHEQWVIARQNERRLEESKVESSQLRNRLTLIEKNISDPDPEAKMHRINTNGEIGASPSPYIRDDTTNSPIMFSSSSGVVPPLPPPSYIYGPSFPPPPPFLPPPLPHPNSSTSSTGLPLFEAGQRPPPLGGRLSSPPPVPVQSVHNPRFEKIGSPPPLMSPPPPPLHFSHNRQHPPLLPPFGNDHHIHPPPPMPMAGSYTWGDETLPPPTHLRNSSFNNNQQREHQRTRNRKGGLHSSGESLDKSHNSEKV